MNRLKKYVKLLVIFISSVFIINYLIIMMVEDFNSTNFTKTKFFTNSKSEKNEIIILGNSTSKNININNFDSSIINASGLANSGLEYLNDYKKMAKHLRNSHLAVVILTPWTFTREYYTNSIKSFLYTLKERFQFFSSIRSYIFPINYSLNFYAFIKQYITKKKHSKLLLLENYQYHNLKSFQQRKEILRITPSELDINAIKEIKKLAKNIILVIPPIHSSARDKRLVDLFIDMPTLDYSNLIDSEEENNLFFDSSHLNSRGLRVLEKRLNKDIKTLLNN